MPFPSDSVFPQISGDPGSGIPGFVGAFFVIVAIVIVAGIVSGIARASTLKKGGLNPFVAEEQLQAMAAEHLRQAAAEAKRPAPEAAPKTIEERLAELDDLAERGVITAEERAAARAKILASG